MRIHSLITLFVSALLIGLFHRLVPRHEEKTLEIRSANLRRLGGKKLKILCNDKIR